MKNSEDREEKPYLVLGILAFCLGIFAYILSKQLLFLIGGIIVFNFTMVSGE